MKILSQLLLLCLLQLPGKLLLVVKIRDLKKVFYCYWLENETPLPLTIRRNNQYSSAHFNSDFEVQHLTNQYFCMSLRNKQNLSQLINEWKEILKVQSLSKACSAVSKVSINRPSHPYIATATNFANQPKKSVQTL